MKDQQLLSYIITQLEIGTDEYQIERYLKLKDIPDAEIADLIAIAKLKLQAELLKTQPAKNKRQFYLWLGLAIFSLILFFFLLPSLDLNQPFTLSLVGAAAICATSSLAILYYKSWEQERVLRNVNPKAAFSSLIVLMAIPGVIVYFLLSWAFQSKSDAILRDTQKETIATVIDGTSVEGEMINSAHIKVKFTTEAGHEIIATEDVSTYKFKDFYKDQTLRIVYSSTNPQNIDLLIDDEKIRELTGSAERIIEPADLISILDKPDRERIPALNRIQLGWTRDNGGFFNERSGNLIVIRNNELNFITRSNDQNYSFPQLLKNDGFTSNTKRNPADPMNQGEKIFENGPLVITVKGYGAGSFVRVLRK